METFDIFLRGRRMKLIHNLMYQSVRRQYDLKQAEVELLLYSEANPGCTSHSAAEFLLLHKGQISQAVDHLKQLGYMKCERDPEDKRFIRMTITDQGREVLNVISEIADEINRELFRDFSAEDFRKFKALSDQLIVNMDQLIRDRKGK